MQSPVKFRTRKSRFTVIGLALATLVAVPTTVAAASTTGNAHPTAS